MAAGATTPTRTPGTAQRAPSVRAPCTIRPAPTTMTANAGAISATGHQLSEQAPVRDLRARTRAPDPRPLLRGMHSPAPGEVAVAGAGDCHGSGTTRKTTYGRTARQSAPGRQPPEGPRAPQIPSTGSQGSRRWRRPQRRARMRTSPDASAAPPRSTAMLNTLSRRRCRLPSLPSHSPQPRRRRDLGKSAQSATIKPTTRPEPRFPRAAPPSHETRSPLTAISDERDTDNRTRNPARSSPGARLDQRCVSPSTPRIAASGSGRADRRWPACRRRCSGCGRCR